MTKISYISSPPVIVAKANNNKRVIHQVGNTKDIIDVIMMADKDSHNHTVKNPQIFKGKTFEETAYKIWKFCKETIPFKEDPIGVQNIKSPAQAIQDGRQGKPSDCKTYAVCIASILRQLGIPFFYRFVINYGPDNQPFTANVHHVYIVIPMPNGKEIAIDPTLSIFNFQNPIYYKKDIKPQDAAIGNIFAQFGNWVQEQGMAAAKSVVKGQQALQTLSDAAGEALRGNVGKAAELRSLALKQAIDSRNEIVSQIPQPEFVKKLNNFFNEQIISADKVITNVQASQAYALQGDKQKAQQALDAAAAERTRNIDKLAAEGKAAGLQVWRQISRFEPTMRTARLIVIGVIRANPTMAKYITVTWMTPETLKLKYPNLTEDKVNKVYDEGKKIIQTWKDIGGWDRDEMEVFRETALKRSREDGFYNPYTDKVFPVEHYMDSNIGGYSRYKIGVPVEADTITQEFIGTPVAAGVAGGTVAAIAGAVAAVGAAVANIIMGANQAEQNKKLVDAQLAKLQQNGTVDANGNPTGNNFQGALAAQGGVPNPQGLSAYLTPTNLVIAAAVVAAATLI